LAVFSRPDLTTVRQPLERMGQIAAQTIIDRIEGISDHVPEIVIEPELIVRSSSGPANRSPARKEGDLAPPTGFGRSHWSVDGRSHRRP
jgi:hypothetical protein